MQVEQGMWQSGRGFVQQNLYMRDKAQLVLYFGERSQLQDSNLFTDLQKMYPRAKIVGCSTGGEILHGEVADESCVFSAVSFDHTKVKTVYSDISAEKSQKVGEYLAKQLINEEDLSALFLLSDGLNVNGSELIKGINEILGPNSPVVVSGGLAGDGDRFQETLVGCNGPAKSGQVVAIGFYGRRLHVRTGTEGGWKNFGPKRLITKSKGSVLYTLDDQPALDLYKKYLGNEAENLPGSALYYPLLVYKEGVEEDGVIRTILSINEQEKSMTFAGDLPEGSIAKFMWGKFDDLIDSAGQSGQTAKAPDNKESLSFMISCIGRKLLMGQHVIGEVESAAQSLGEKNHHMGFYSYGEIAPGSLGNKGQGKNCSTQSFLHNQTMTITTLWEEDAA